MSAYSKAGPCVAVVDDDDSVCRSVARLLTASGYQAVTYLSAEEFLGDATHPHFDCLLLDIQLGGISGLELGERLAESGSTTPVVFLTAQEITEALEQAVHDQHAALLRKSDPGALLITTIDDAIHHVNTGS